MLEEDRAYRNRFTHTKIPQSPPFPSFDRRKRLSYQKNKLNCVLIGAGYSEGRKSLAEKRDSDVETECHWSTQSPSRLNMTLATEPENRALSLCFKRRDRFGEGGGKFSGK
ncbi:hypothetical protein TNIN_244691 [Trichonephila inaurata madagascariensis]|uniref:Uncharacterized protein n=1 Tax=Trichonephila inaurata madagascariensis TaxID=2747483 RepID=A0A8X7CB76_9ARAC|nr:hypothetical protein TNIN_244691 [Trichonephila inaurata madagascariensis]